MKTTTITSRQFNQDVSKAKRASENGPVFITDRGNLSHVLLAIEDYQKLTGTDQDIVELLAMPSKDHIEFEPETLKTQLFRQEDFE